MSACALPHSAFSDGTVCMNGWVCSRPLPDRPEEHIEAGAGHARYSVCSIVSAVFTVVIPQSERSEISLRQSSDKTMEQSKMTPTTSEKQTKDTHRQQCIHTKYRSTK